jgi:PAS domain S-box-containing protein
MRTRYLGHGLAFLAGLAVIWGCAVALVRLDRDTRIHEAELASVYQAQASAENVLSIVKRLDAVLLEMRTVWALEPKNFNATAQRRQADLADLVFQIAVIGADGFLVSSNLTASAAPVWLGDREHFRAHLDGAADHLFISEPLKGKVSGKWSLQFSRPVLQGGTLKAVIVISVTPDMFVAYSKRLGMNGRDVLTVTNARGVILARSDDPESLGRRLTEVPFLGDAPQVRGYYRRASQTDGVDRIYGYQRVDPEGLVMIVGRSIAGVLSEHPERASAILAIAGVLSAVLGVLLLMFVRLDALRARAREAQARFVAVVEGSTDAIIGRDLSGRITLWNAAAERLFGLSADDCIGHAVQGILPAETRAGEAELMRKVLAGEAVSRYDTRRLTRDRREIMVASSIFPIRDGEGKVSGTAEIVRDITDAKQTRAALTASRALLKSMMDSSHGYFWSVGADDFGLLTWNEGFAQHVHASQGIMLELGMRPDQMLPSDEAEDYVAMYRRALASGTCSVEYRNRRTGSVLSLNFSLLKRGDSVFGITVYGEEIGERRYRPAVSPAQRVIDRSGAGD